MSDLQIFFTHLLVYFIVYSFWGWVLESVYKTIFQKKIINSGFLYGPFCPIYGIGAMIMYLFLIYFKDNIILLFIISMIVLSIWEYVVGLGLEKVFKTKYWDYTGYFCNINGRVCLLNSAFWGILGIVFIHFIHPVTQRYITRIKVEYLLVIGIVVLLIIITDFIISARNIINLNRRLEILEELNNNIKEKLNRLKEINNKNKEKIMLEFQDEKIHLKEKIKELKLKKKEIKSKTERYTQRLTTIFPTLKSKAIENFIRKRDIKLRKIKTKRSKK